MSVTHSIKIENLSLGFEKILFDNIDLEVKRNEITILKGESGVGKSTLLKIILGLQPITKGKVIIEGIHLNSANVKEVRSKIAWLPSNLDSIFKGVLIDFIRKVLNGANSKVEREVIEHNFKNLNLKPSLLLNEFENISSGEKQRVGLIICKLLNREIFILDEPTSNLDDENIKVIENFILGFNSTVLMISHNNSLVENANRIFELKNHKIEIIK